MKIIQILAAASGESPGSFESQLLGLGDDGGLYEYVWPRQAMARDKYLSYTADPQKMLTYTDGTTQGWQLICMSIDRPKALPHPLDPTRNERQ